MNKFKGNRTSFLIVVLLTSFILVIYLNILSLTDDQSTNFKDGGIHFQGKIMRYSFSSESYANQVIDFPNLDLSQNFHSPLFNKRLPMQVNSIKLSTFYSSNGSYQKNLVQLHSSKSPVNFVNTDNQNNGQNTNNFYTQTGFNTQAFTSNLFPEKRLKNHSLINSRNDTTQQHTEFHVLNSISGYNTNISFLKYYNVQNDNIDPGGPPDGDEIPVPNGNYFLLVLLSIYACWKIKNVRE